MEAYQKGAKIGEGTYGSVYRATHVPSGRTVAMKKVGPRAVLNCSHALPVYVPAAALPVCGHPHPQRCSLSRSQLQLPGPLPAPATQRGTIASWHHRLVAHRHPVAPPAPAACRQTRRLRNPCLVPAWPPDAHLLLRPCTQVRMASGAADPGISPAAAPCPEIRLLQRLGGPHVVLLLDVVLHKQNLHLVMEHMEGDLEEVIKDRRRELGEAQVAALMAMLLQVGPAGAAAAAAAAAGSGLCGWAGVGHVVLICTFGNVWPSALHTCCALLERSCPGPAPPRTQQAVFVSLTAPLTCPPAGPPPRARSSSGAPRHQALQPAAGSAGQPQDCRLWQRQGDGGRGRAAARRRCRWAWRGEGEGGRSGTSCMLCTCLALLALHIMGSMLLTLCHQAIRPSGG
jgi:hypothetical protein